MVLKLFLAVTESSHVLIKYVFAQYISIIILKLAASSSS